MSISIYNSLNSSSHRAARAFLVATLAAPPKKGNWNGWSIDTGRLEDGLCETLLAVAKRGALPRDHILVPFGADSSGCSHGVAGIFGINFAESLTADGRTLIVDIDYTVSGNRVTFTDYRFTLV